MSVNENGSASARGIGTETETVPRETADTVADRPEGRLTETGTTQETADSVTAFAQPVGSSTRVTDPLINSENDLTEGIDLRTVGYQLDSPGA